MDETPVMPELPAFESLDLPELPDLWPKAKCAPCGALEDELRGRCEALTQDASKVDACTLELGEAIEESKRLGTKEGLREKLYATFVKYREVNGVQEPLPNGAETVNPEGVQSTAT